AIASKAHHPSTMAEHETGLLNDGITTGGLLATNLIFALDANGDSVRALSGQAPASEPPPRGQAPSPAETPPTNSGDPQSLRSSTPAAPAVATAAPNPSPIVPNLFDGNHDGVADALQAAVADVRSATNGKMVVLDGGGHRLSDVRALSVDATPNVAASLREARPGLVTRSVTATQALPLGVFSFRIHDVTPRGAATVKMILPAGFTPDGYVKQ